MIKYTPTQAHHFHDIGVQETQEVELSYVSGRPELVEDLIQSSLCLTGFVSGAPVAIAGFYFTTRHSRRAWAFFAPEAGPYMLGITRRAKAMMASLPCPRIDMTVNEGFIQGERFAGLLGMDRETPTPLRHFGVLGEDQNIYALVREGL